MATDALVFTVEQPVDLSLGVAARALGRLDDSDRHLATAIELSERAGAPTFVAVSQFEQARTLAARGRVGDAERADELARQALATAEELGLGRIERLTGELLAPP